MSVSYNTKIKLILCVVFVVSVVSRKGNAQDTLSNVSNELFMAFDGWGIAEQLVVPGKYSVVGKIGWLHRTTHAISFDGGYMNFSRQVSDSIKSYDYQSAGYYIRGGFEQNIFRRNRFNERNFIFIGLHLGYAHMQHRGDNIVIPDKFWGTRYYSFKTTIYQSLWVDFSVSIRTQLTRHFALGWEVKMGRVIYSARESSLIPYYIAGFGKSQNKFSVGISYYLYYTLGW